MTAAEKLARAYCGGLKNAYCACGAQEAWDHFASIAHGASREDLAVLKALYPEVPESLLALLGIVDGTYFREYQGETAAFYFLGSGLEGYPYYLLSAKQMAQAGGGFAKWGGFLIRREFDGIPVDEKITDSLESLRWLHFSDCMNNGGTSRLYLDFSPSEKGRAGQVVRWLHDPGELAVIADSFDEYLQMLMDQEYDFINEDTAEE